PAARSRGERDHPDRRYREDQAGQPEKDEYDVEGADWRRGRRRRAVGRGGRDVLVTLRRPSRPEQPPAESLVRIARRRRLLGQPPAGAPSVSRTRTSRQASGFAARRFPGPGRSTTSWPVARRTAPAHRK